MSTAFFERLQEDCYGRLLAASDLAEVAIILERKALTEKEVQQRLATVAGRANKAGACCIVELPTIVVPDGNATGPQGEVLQTVLVLEHPEINTSSRGTGISAETLAIAVVQLLHHFLPLPYAGVMSAAREAIVPDTSFEGVVGYRVVLRLPAGLEAPAKVATPTISPASGAAPQSVTLTCATAGAAIYYTLDGSYPSSANSAATLYSGPVNVATAATLRAAAEKAGLQQSDVNAAEYS